MAKKTKRARSLEPDVPPGAGLVGEVELLDTHAP
jgi:hypothetical protein